MHVLHRQGAPTIPVAILGIVLIKPTNVCGIFRSVRLTFFHYRAMCICPSFAATCARYLPKLTFFTLKNVSVHLL